jgi:aquaporin Z
MPMTATLKRHWPEYLIEGAALGLFMIAATLFTLLIEHPASPIRQAIPDALTRRLLMGLAMGATAVGIIYSPWGRRSGAHMNPSVTLTFLRLGKIAPADAFFYMAAIARRPPGRLGGADGTGRAVSALRRDPPGPAR